MAAPLVDAVMQRWFTEEFAQVHPETVESFRKMFLSTDDTGYAHACDVLARPDLGPALGRISCPTLVISGEHDPANPVSDQRAIAEGIIGSKHVIVSGAAHLVPASHPVEVADLLAEHCRSAAL